MLDLQSRPPVRRRGPDWALAASYWGNLIGPDPIPYADMIDIVAAQQEQ